MIGVNRHLTPGMREDTMRRIQRIERALGAVLVVSLTLMGCAAARPGPGPTAAGSPGGPTTPAQLAAECRQFAKRFDYAGRSVGGRSAATVLLAPLAIGIADDHHRRSLGVVVIPEHAREPLPGQRQPGRALIRQPLDIRPIEPEQAAVAGPEPGRHQCPFHHEYS